MDFPLFPFDTFPKRLKKCPLHVGVSLYMLMKNGDRQLIGGVHLIWWGYHAVCRTQYGWE